MAVDRLLMTLMGKGATNHLHRREVVEAFNKKGVEVSFLVKENFMPIIEKIPGCEYYTCQFDYSKSRTKTLRGMCAHIRSFYPAKDMGKRTRFAIENKIRPKLRSRIGNFFINFLARYRWIMELIVIFEGLLYRSIKVNGIDPASVDKILMRGVGTSEGEYERILTNWAGRNKIPVVHIVGNWDNLSSKGFLGVPIDKLLVWGASMKEDAISLQGVDESKIDVTGSIRFNSIDRSTRMGRDEYLKSIGLDPGKKTILFAGSLYEFHYFEMLDVYEELNSGEEIYQLVIRVYPNKRLLNSQYLKALISHTKTLAGVFVSVADPNFNDGSKDRDVLQIEEYHLVHALQYSDVVVNLYSSIALEACIFDKPSVYMWYFPKRLKVEISPAVYKPYHLTYHNRRVISYGAMRMASNRKELISQIIDAIEYPEKFCDERRISCDNELGKLDGKACDKLVESCINR